MSRLLSYELRKLFRGKMLYIFSLLFSVLPVMSNVIETLIFEHSGVSNAGTFVRSLLPMLLTVSFLLYSLYMTMFGPWMTSLFFASDYSRGGLLPNVVSRGYSRTQIFFAKYIVLLIFHLFVFLFATGASLLSGFPYLQADFHAAIRPVQWHLVICEFASMLAVISFLALISVLFSQKMSVVFSVLLTSPMISLAVLIMSFFEKTRAASALIMTWIPQFRFAWTAIVYMASSYEIPYVQVTKIDFVPVLISSAIWTVGSLFVAALVVRRKDINK